MPNETEHSKAIFNHTLAIKDITDEWIREYVSDDVYFYVRALEAAIQTGNHKGLKNRYPERFK